MTESAQTSHSQTAWTRRLFDELGYPVWVVGVGAALFGILAFSLQELLLGRHLVAAKDSRILDDMRGAITHVVITVYLLTAQVYARRTTEQSIAALLPLVDPRRVDELLARSRSERIGLALSVLFGVLLYFSVITQISPGDISFRPASWSPEVAWHRVLGFAMALLTPRLFMLLVLESGRLSAVARAIQPLDLLSPESISPFARQGLTYALLVIGVVSAFALFLIDLSYLPVVTLVLAPALIVAVVALLLPLRGIRARIIETKREELRWCREQMRERRARLSNGARADAVRLDELVAWEARIQAVREWPLDASTFTRFALYLLLPLGSWAGGALVERGIDALLD